MARVMIEINDALVEACKWHTQGICELTGIESGILAEAVTEGKLIPENATNGDVIKALFPDIIVEYGYGLAIGVDFGVGGERDLSRDWWNAPYKAGDTE